MPTTGQKGFGTTISYAGSPVHSVINVRDITIGGVEYDVIDYTSNSSTDGFRDKLPGMPDAGEVEFDLVYDENEASVLYGVLGVSKAWTVTLPDSATFTFSGYIKSFGSEAPYEDAVANSVTIKVSGALTFTPGA